VDTLSATIHAAALSMHAKMGKLPEGIRRRMSDEIPDWDTITMRYTTRQQGGCAWSSDLTV